MPKLLRMETPADPRSRTRYGPSSPLLCRVAVEGHDDPERDDCRDENLLQLHCLFPPHIRWIYGTVSACRDNAAIPHDKPFTTSGAPARPPDLPPGRTRTGRQSLKKSPLRGWPEWPGWPALLQTFP